MKRPRISAIQVGPTSHRAGNIEFQTKDDSGTDHVADAMNEVAWCYLEGFGCKKDKVGPRSLSLSLALHLSSVCKDNLRSAEALRSFASNSQSTRVYTTLT